MAESGVGQQFRCRRCGGGVETGDRFCLSCGVNLTGQVHRALPGGRRCPGCGAACSARAKFCNGCGAVLGRRSRRRSRWWPALVVGVIVLWLIATEVNWGDAETNNVAVNQVQATEVAEIGAATPVPATAEWKAAYPRIEDVREIAIRPWNRMGERLSFRGTIAWIRVARPGETIALGDEDERGYEAEVWVAVETPTYGYEYLVVGYDLDTVGMFEGTMVRVYGELVDTESSDDYEEYAVPLIDAELIEKDPFDGLPPSSNA